MMRVHIFWGLSSILPMSGNRSSTGFVCQALADFMHSFLEFCLDGEMDNGKAAMNLY